MKKYLLLSLFFTVVSTIIFAISKNNQWTPKPQILIISPPPSPEPPVFIRPNSPPVSSTKVSKHKIQVALLLDTSNSMDGLIDQAKSQLWKMVNELASTTKDGEVPSIEISLFEYGNNNLSVAGGYVRRVVPMTYDLDMISEELFGLKTNGGEEYCGWVIKDATLGLTWSDNNNDLKIIIIAGNEPFDQGGVDFRTSCKKASQKGILVNSIFCGDYDEGVRTFWKEGAELTGGVYLNINHNDRVVHIPTPYDDDIIKLNQRLNDTYIGYGTRGAERIAFQKTQDSNAGSYGRANAAERAYFKAKSAYKNADWDLVDKMEEEPEILSELDENQLPDNMKKMTKEERKTYVGKMAKERASIQSQILDLEKKARQFRTEKEKEMGEKQTLDQVMLKEVVKQAKAKNFVRN